MEMSEDLAQEIAELKRRLAELEAKQSAHEPPRPRMNMQPIDYTEQFRLPADAAQKMAAVVPDVKCKMTAEQVQSSWARSRISGPSGFGPPKWEEGKRQPVPVKKAEEEKMKDTRSPQTRIFDAMVDAMVGGPNDTSKLR